MGGEDENEGLYASLITFGRSMEFLSKLHKLPCLFLFKLLRQNSPYLLYKKKGLLNASSLAFLILLCNLNSSYASKFAVPHLQSQASTLGMCPCSCKQGSVSWDAAVPPHSAHQLPVSCLLRQHTFWLPVTLLSVMDPFFDIFEPTSTYFFHMSVFFLYVSVTSLD